MSSCADYSHDHLIFPRQQSNTLRAMDWEKTPPLKSWMGLLGPWLGLAVMVALILPFLLAL